LEQFISENPSWQQSLVPIHSRDSPVIIDLMEEAAEICHVGPMAAVAGALADRMQQAMVRGTHAQMTVVENGGEIIVQSHEDIIIGLYVLTDVLKAQIGFKFAGGSPLLGIATSSATFSHALSFGDADAVTIFAETAAIADAAATCICNLVKGPDIEKAILIGLEETDRLEKIHGAFITFHGKIGTKGKIPELIRIKDGEQFILQEKFTPI
jgi:ApbE superfamily uncharacterized protein (UPF0280 family)